MFRSSTQESAAPQSRARDFGSIASWTTATVDGSPSGTATANHFEFDVSVASWEAISSQTNTAPPGLIIGSISDVSLDQ